MRIHKRGFTLLELMIAIALMLIVMLMLRSMFVNAQEMYIRATRRVDVYAQARAALDVMEQDLMKMRKDDDEAILSARSLTPSDWRDPKSPREDRKVYSPMDDWDEEADGQTRNIRELLSFHATVTWYDRIAKKSVTGKAMVVYYLRKRFPVPDQEEEGAYLVRRIIPQRTLGDLATTSGKLSEIVPVEDDLASFVYAAQVYVDDQGAFLMGPHGRSFDIMPEASTRHPNQKWLWNREAPVTAAPTKGQVQKKLQIPETTDRFEFGGRWSSQTHTPGRTFTSTRWNYPGVVMVELTMIDRSMLRYDPTTGEGTYRSFSRAVQLPLSGPPIRLDGKDLELMRQ